MKSTEHRGPTHPQSNTESSPRRKPCRTPLPRSLEQMRTLSVTHLSTSHTPGRHNLSPRCTEAAAAICYFSQLRGQPGGRWARYHTQTHAELQTDGQISRVEPGVPVVCHTLAVASAPCRYSDSHLNTSLVTKVTWHTTIPRFAHSMPPQNTHTDTRRKACSPAGPAEQRGAP